MMESRSIDGSAMFVDPLAIQVVAPAFAQPAAGVPHNMNIPKPIGATLILMGFNIAVRGTTAEVAEAVAEAQRKARRPLSLLN